MSSNTSLVVNVVGAQQRQTPAPIQQVPGMVPGMPGLSHAPLRDNLVHGAVQCTRGGAPGVVLEGLLTKKGRHRSTWKRRRFELHKNRSLHYYEGRKHKGVVHLGQGALVRNINETGYGRKFQVMDSKTSRVFDLEAANVETRDVWVSHLQNMISTGGVDLSAPQQQPQQQPSHQMLPAPPQQSPQQEQPPQQATPPMQDNMIEVTLPETLPPAGGVINLELSDGRKLQVPIPHGAMPGQKVRVCLPPSVERSSATQAIRNSVQQQEAPLPLPGPPPPRYSDAVAASADVPLAVAVPVDGQEFSFPAQASTEEFDEYSHGKSGGPLYGEGAAAEEHVLGSDPDNEKYASASTGQGMRL
eukprot:CAMPEP_0118962658 /NCGR_PEP_ID=MMETSP1173-20130426/910_1 /TAXON_ID=1034831 /ORGANISM="Rhizochromulina marina cf, Strain CCMP1243" /LENGTH=357 /DNA_ID=CAMNT_0006910943 /DNA_START=53 /DNA_END=1126 /DNA_ORIENTATION=+